MHILYIKNYPVEMITWGLLSPLSQHCFCVNDIMPLMPKLNEGKHWGALAAPLRTVFQYCVLTVAASSVSTLVIKRCQKHAFKRYEERLIIRNLC